MATDDLSALLAQQPQPAIRYGQGRVLEWDPDTFANVIDWNGVRLVDVPVFGGTDALTFAPGQTVSLLGWDATGSKGITQWFVLGRLLLPSSDAAAQVIAFMATSLAKSISAQVFAERIAGQQVLDLVQTTQTSFGDLSGSPGPAVTVEVTEAGAMVVQISALMVNGARTAGGPGQTFAEMGFEISGASSVVPSANRALIVGGPVSSAQPDGITMGATKTVYVSGLNPGIHTVTAKYTTEVFSVTAAGAFFSRRDLVVTAF